MFTLNEKPSDQITEKTIYLSKDMDDDLRSTAKVKGVSVNDLILEALKVALERRY